MNINVMIKDGDLRLGVDIEIDNPKNLAKALAEAAVILSRGLDGRGEKKPEPENGKRHS